MRARGRPRLPGLGKDLSEHALMFAGLQQMVFQGCTPLQRPLFFRSKARPRVEQRCSTPIPSREQHQIDACSVLEEAHTPSALPAAVPLLLNSAAILFAQLRDPRSRASTHGAPCITTRACPRAQFDTPSSAERGFVGPHSWSVVAATCGHVASLRLLLLLSFNCTTLPAACGLRVLLPRSHAPE